jgi:cell shape-determining protein MreC
MCQITEELIMGIGNGDGNLFVKGDYRSITHLQNKIFELEELRRENKKLKDEITALEHRLEIAELHPVKVD